MSTLKVNTIGNKGSAVDFPNKLKVRGNAIEQAYTESGTEPSSPSEGDFWWDSTNEVVYQYINGEFKTISLAPPMNWGGDRAVFQTTSGGYDYITITSAGNASDFGNLSTSHNHDRGAASSSKTRGIFAGGSQAGTLTNIIEYITIATLGDGTDFGDLSGTFYYFASASNGTRSLFGGGYKDGASSGNRTNEISYITIATTGNTTDFGDLNNTINGCTAGSDATYILFLGGSGTINVIDYVTAMTTGNATDFGDMTYASQEHGTVSDATRTIHAGGYTGSAVTNSMGYVTTATTGNATDFGDLTTARYGIGTANNTTVAVFIGGANSSYAATNIIDQCTIQTAANCTDFGDLAATEEEVIACAGNPS